MERNELRYWDGSAWTHHVSNAGVVSEDALNRGSQDSSGSKRPGGSKGKAQTASTRTAAPPWAPTVNVPEARSIVVDLVYATNSQGRVSNEQIDVMRDRWSRASDAPTDPMGLMKFESDEFRTVMERPWRWLAANARAAQGSDHEFVGFAAFWAFMWKHSLEPNFGQYEKMNFLISSVPSEVCAELVKLNDESMRELSPDHVLFGDETGQFTAETLLSVIPSGLL
jgi:hypothetical protein